MGPYKLTPGESRDSVTQGKFSFSINIWKSWSMTDGHAGKFKVIILTFYRFLKFYGLSRDGLRHWIEFHQKHQLLRIEKFLVCSLII